MIKMKKMFHGFIAQERNNTVEITSHCFIANSESEALAEAQAYCLQKRPFKEGWKIAYVQNNEVPMHLLQAMKPFIL